MLCLLVLVLVLIRGHVCVCVCGSAGLHEELERVRRELRGAQAERDEGMARNQRLEHDYQALDKRNNAHRAMLNHLSQQVRPCVCVCVCVCVIFSHPFSSQIQRNETHISHLKSLYNSYPSSKKLFHGIYPVRV